MINQSRTLPHIPHTSKTRMRYRGPIESIKINHFKQGITRDIIRIGKEVEEHHVSLKRYMKETLIQSKCEIEIMQGDGVVFNGYDNVPLHKLNHIITEGVLQ